MNTGYETLAETRNFPLTVAAGAPFRARSRFTAGAAAARTIVQDADVHLLVDAACRLLEGQAHVVLLGSEVELLLLAGGLAEVSERASATVPENCSEDMINRLITGSAQKIII